METEIKLQIPDAHIGAFKRHPLLAEAAGKQMEETHTDTYFDTASLELWRNGWILRIRSEGPFFIQTVKRSSSPSGHAFERDEWEWQLDNDTPDPAHLKGDGLASLLKLIEKSGERLRPMFVNQTHRTSWLLQLAHDTQVECALDAGQLLAGKRSTPINEVELELKRGEPSELFGLALRLQQDLPLTLGPASKAARGYALLAGKPPRRALKAAPVRLRPKMSLASAFRCMAGNCLSQIQGNEDGVKHLDVDSLHQMRVGLRRLRALFDLFAPLLVLPGRIAQDLQWLAGELGPARDWDVLAHDTAPRIAAASGAAQPLVAAALQQAETRHRRLAALLQEARYTRCMLGLHAWLLSEPWLEGAHREAWKRKAAGGMAPLLGHAMRRLRKRAKGWNEADAHVRHRIRIATKKARYAIEFFGRLLERRELRAGRRLLAKLQEELGRLNDAAVASKLLDELAATDAGAADAATFARGYLAAEGSHADPELDKYVRRAAKLRVG